MSETLGSLCDKLTIVKLKEWHSEKQPERMRSLATQERQLREEIDALTVDAASGGIPAERLTFAANKVYRKEGNAVPEVTGSIGAVFSHSAEVNCRLWYEVDKSYEIEKVPADARDGIVKQLPVLNLERTQCIDATDRQLRAAVEQLQSKATEH
jgi:hypothetical protein